MNLITDKSQYGLEQLNSANDSDIIHIFINGFMSDEKDDNLCQEWINSTKYIINENDMKYVYTWDSGMDYTKLNNYNPFKKDDTLVSRVKNLSHFVVARVNPIIGVGYVLTSLIAQWKIANKNTIKYGISLANEIKSLKIKNKDLTIKLYAHSLGANLVKNTLLELSKSDIKIQNVYLFGGASCSKDIENWTIATNIVEQGVYNFFIKDDKILKKLYKIAEFKNSPIGLEPLFLNDSYKIFNHDVSYVVDGHMDYKNNLSTIFRNIR